MCTRPPRVGRRPSSGDPAGRAWRTSDVRRSAPRPGQVVTPPGSRAARERCQTRRCAPLSPAGGRAAATRPPRRARAAGEQPGRGDREVGVDQRPAPRPGPGRAPGRRCSVATTAASPPARSRCRNTPPVSTTSPTSPGRSRLCARRCRRTAITRRQRGDPAVLGRAARVARDVADLAGHPLRRWARAGRPPPGRRCPRPGPPPARRPRPRAPRGRPRRCAGRPPSRHRVDVGGRAADVDHQHPRTADPRPARGAACPTASGVATRTSRRNRGATAGPRPPSDVPRVQLARARPAPDRAPARRGAAATLSQATTVRPVARSSASASSRAAALPASTIGYRIRALASRPALCSSPAGSSPSAPPISSTTPGRVLRSMPHVGGLQRPGVHVHDARAGRAATRCPASVRRQPLGADHGQPQPAARRRAGQQLRLRPRRRAGRRHRPHGRVHAREHVGGGGRVLGETGQRAVGPDEHRLRPGRAHVEADRGAGRRASRRGA